MLRSAVIYLILVKQLARCPRWFCPYRNFMSFSMSAILWSTLVIFSLFEVKLREMLTNLSISFLETLTDIVREAIPSESKTSSIEMLLLSTQMPMADSNALHTQCWLQTCRSIDEDPSW